MKKYPIYTHYKKYLADTFTPVGLYQKLRDHFPNSILLESSDYHGNENSISFICCDPIAGIKLSFGTLTCTYPDGSSESHSNLKEHLNMAEQMSAFMNAFVPNSSDISFPTQGLFGYTGYDAVAYFEDIDLKAPQSERRAIPEMIYNLYRFVIVIDHFRDELFITEQSLKKGQGSGIEQIESLIGNRNFSSFRFRTNGREESDCTDEEFKKRVSEGKKHCRRGDVFQVVLSREFSQSFSGDEFNVYRSLRSVNPSPYLFYFDYGNFKLFGSSPEAQLIVKDRMASIHPIAGTFRRTGDERADLALAEKLKADPKENAEHVMLVDLARNDLSRDCREVEVETFREIQYYSHVIHLVSKVSGKLKVGRDTWSAVADTFPAGTLTGAPKHKAMQLIDRYEKHRRGFYGGCIGMVSFQGDFNHAIIIRSFLSKNNRLFYQAGAGVVDSSSEESELNEVNNKLAALKKAIERAADL